MKRKKLFIQIISVADLVVPNTIYLLCNGDILKEANAIALTMTALLILAVVGLGALAHFKANGGVWCALIGVFILALSNISYVAGIALIIEGAGLAIDGYVFKPLLVKYKTEELERNGKSITYTREIK